MTLPFVNSTNIYRKNELTYLRIHSEKWARKLRGANEKHVQEASRA